MFPPKTFLAGLMRKIFMVALFVPAVSMAQQPAGITFGGFVKMDGAFDSRQTVNAREGHLLLWPAQKSMGTPVNGTASEDLNANPNLLFAMFQTRLFGKIAAPDVKGAKVSGYLEGDFFGATNDAVSHYVLRHAWVKLEKPKTELLFGQTWSPLFGTVFPGTVNFNTGAPMQPFARMPQIAGTLKPNAKVRLTATLMQQRDVFETVGMGRKAQQRAALPAIVGSASMKSGKVLVGADVAYKTLQPNPMSDKISTVAGDVYLKADGANATLMAKVATGGDMSDHLSVGGWVQLTENNKVSYEALHTTTAWVDVQTKKPTALGLFAGFLTNGGAASDLSTGATKSYTNSRGSNITSVWRVSPRVVHNAGKFRVAFELEVTGAEFGSAREANGAPKVDAAVANDGSVVNVRGLLGTYLFF